MPYALVAGDSRLLAGLADEQLWQSSDRGQSWTSLRLEGDALGAVVALAFEQPAGRSVLVVPADPHLPSIVGGEVAADTR